MIQLKSLRCHSRENGKGEILGIQVEFDLSGMLCRGRHKLIEKRVIDLQYLVWIISSNGLEPREKSSAGQQN